MLRDDGEIGEEGEEKMGSAAVGAWELTNPKFIENSHGGTIKKIYLIELSQIRTDVR